MGEKGTKKNKLSKEERKEKRRAFWSENKELLVQIGIGLLGFAGAVIGIVGIKIDHQLTREEQERKRAVIHDNICDVEWYLDKPLTIEETKEMIRRENNGEFRNEILESMGKI